MKKGGAIIGVFLILLLIAGGFFFFMNQSKKYNISDMFNLHGNVVSYGVYETEEELIKEFEKLSEGENYYLVLGDENKITISSYEEILYGNVNLVFGESRQNFDINKKKYFLQEIFPRGKNVEILIGDEKYEIEVEEGEKIYMIVEKNE